MGKLEPSSSFRSDWLAAGSDKAVTSTNTEVRRTFVTRPEKSLILNIVFGWRICDQKALNVVRRFAMIRRVRASAADPSDFRMMEELFP